MPKVVLIETRATWLAGPNEGLSAAYRFQPGVPVDVTDADAAVLFDCRQVGGRSFVPAASPDAEQALVESAERAAWKAGGWQPPKGPVAVTEPAPVTAPETTAPVLEELKRAEAEAYTATQAALKKATAGGGR